MQPVRCSDVLAKMKNKCFALGYISYAMRKNIGGYIKIENGFFYLLLIKQITAVLCLDEYQICVIGKFKNLKSLDVWKIIRFFIIISVGQVFLSISLSNLIKKRGKGGYRN